MDAVTLARSKTVVSAPITESNVLICDCSPHLSGIRLRPGLSKCWNGYRPDARYQNCVKWNSITSIDWAPGRQRQGSISSLQFGIGLARVQHPSVKRFHGNGLQ